VTITVVDSKPPVLRAPSDITVEAGGELTSVPLGAAEANDLFPVIVTNDAPSAFPLGKTAVLWTATDANGNSTTAVQYVTVVDTVSPILSGRTSVRPNVDGWFKEEVTVTFEASDNGSGIAFVSPDTVLSAEGRDQSVTGTAEDHAGNKTTATVTGIHIDQTAPTIVLDSSIQDNYLSHEKLIVRFEAADGLSGLESVKAWFNEDEVANGQRLDLASRPGVNRLTVSAADRAGNRVEVTKDIYVSVAANVDVTPDTWNGKSTANGKSPITVYIELPAEMDVSSIDRTSIRLLVGGRSFAVRSEGSDIGDYDGDQTPDLMVKADRALLSSGWTGGDLEIKVTGKLLKGVPFSGSDIVKAAGKGRP
jgi:hypothetical protein